MTMRMTQLEFVYEQLLGPPYRRNGNGESFWRCPKCHREDNKFHSLPEIPGVKQRGYCQIDGRMGDEKDMLQLIYPNECWGSIMGRFKQLEGMYQKSQASGKTLVLNFAGPESHHHPHSPPTSSSSSGARGGGWRQLEQQWERLTDEERAGFTWLRSVQMRLERETDLLGNLLWKNVNVHNLALYCWQFDQSIQHGDEQHLRDCTDPNCDAVVCMVARLPW